MPLNSVLVSEQSAKDGFCVKSPEEDVGSHGAGVTSCCGLPEVSGGP